LLPFAVTKVVPPLHHLGWLTRRRQNSCPSGITRRGEEVACIYLKISDRARYDDTLSDVIASISHALGRDEVTLRENASDWPLNGSQTSVDALRGSDR